MNSDVELQRVFGSAKTIGEFLKQDEKRKLEPLLMSVPNGEKVLRHILRLYEPWPDWVLRVAVEVYGVYVPTIKKEVIYDTFRLIHFFIFEMQLDDSTPSATPKFPEFNPKVIGAMIGHLSKMPEHSRSKINMALKNGQISPEQKTKLETEFAEQLSTDSLQLKLQPHLNKYFAARPNKLLETSETITDARRKTLDKHGNLKETTATKVYEAILRDWVEIEELAGSTEMCAFLKPALDGNENDQEKRLDRVKKICRRMGIKFNPRVKGQSRPPALSLPSAR